MSTRRSFVTTVAAATVYLASPLRLLAQSAQRQGIPAFSPAALGAYQQGILNIARFQSLLGSSFRVFLDNNEVLDIVLIKVKTMDAVRASQQASSPVPKSGQPKPPAQGRASEDANATFMVRFSTGKTYIPQDVYVLDHGTLGSFSALLVPGPISSTANTCAIVFNYAPAKPTAVSN